MAVVIVVSIRAEYFYMSQQLLIIGSSLLNFHQKIVQNQIVRWRLQLNVKVDYLKKIFNKLEMSLGAAP